MSARTHTVKRLGRFARSERGTQLVELAITLPLLLMMFAAVAEFGRYFYTYATLAKATRAGARYVANVPATAGGANTTEDPKAKRLVVYGDPNAADGSTPLAPGLGVGNVQIVRTGTTGGVPGTVRVEIINYNYTPLINLGKAAGGASWLSVGVKPGTTMRYLINTPSV
ncbi:MAG TPA: TadE family protein [Pyrinomonadaceae bacterium]|nr:TadE family protein [Pyrinomonadaceae bacterium]